MKEKVFFKCRMVFNISQNVCQLCVWKITGMQFFWKLRLSRGDENTNSNFDFSKKKKKSKLERFEVAAGSKRQFNFSFKFKFRQKSHFVI
jgi:hypothetical protein